MPMNRKTRSPASPPRQLSLLLDRHVTHGLSASEKRAATGALAALLLEASGQAMEIADER